MTSRIFGLDKIDENTISNADLMPLPKGLFFVKPDYFDVEDAINPHMLDDEGDLHEIEHEIAVDQWEKLVATYEGIGLESRLFEGKEGCPDMVFCANQSFLYINEKESNGLS